MMYALRCSKRGYVKETRDGTYRLYEVVVPAGYISTYKYIQFEIENRSIKNVTTDTGDTGKVKINANKLGLTIANESGAVLPCAGGPGTQMFIILGSILILGAGAALWRKQRLF